MADTGGNGPLALECSTWSLAPLVVIFAPWATTPRASGYNSGGVEGVYGTKNTPMLQWCIIAETKKRFEGHTPPHLTSKYIRLLGRLSPIRPTHRCEAWVIIRGVRRPFPPMSAMVVRLLGVFVACWSTNHFCLVKPRHIGYRPKALVLVSSKTLLDCTDAET